MNNFTNRKAISICMIALFALFFSVQQNAQAQTFPCGSQDLEDCNCLGGGTLTADTDPCSLGSTSELVRYLLVDENNATVGGDDDDGLIDQISSSSTFTNVPSGDYAIYYLYFDADDRFAIDPLTVRDGSISALKNLGIEGPVGTWTSTNPDFVLIMSGVATVNGPACDPCPGFNVGNFVWFDSNGDGVQDPGEPGFPGVVVKIYDANGNLVGTTVTDANGNYAFEVGAGTYYLEIEYPAFMEGTAANATIDGFDSDFDADGLTGLFTVGADADFSFDAGIASMGNNPTPIFWSGFEGNAGNVGNELAWSTATETDNDYFVIESSTDGVNFSQVGIVKGAGTTTNASNYSFVDDAANDGVTYYRIVSVDYNGNKSASYVISIIRGNVDNGISNIYPVPASDMVYVEFLSNELTEITIEIYDVSGRVLTSAKADATTGVNVVNLDVTSLPIGTYFVNITTASGESSVEKIIKQ